MNRPHLENYYDKALTCLPPIYISREEQYIKALEQYCDELEKALDWACEELELMSEAHYISREEWKEWLMKDE